MSHYDNCSREELIGRIEELEARLASAADTAGRFRDRYACKILDSIPDMLTVLRRDGTLVELVSSEQTNHVGIEGPRLVGRNIRSMLSPEVCRNVKDNLENVFASGKGSSSHHDITLDGRTRNYENRIMPLDGEHALCICRDITEAEVAKHELEMVKYALNNVDEEIYACAVDGTMEYANERFRRRHDLKGDLSRRKVYEFWSIDATRQLWEERLAKIRRDNGAYKYTVRLKNAQGRIVAWDIVAYIIYDHFKEREIVWFFGRDITRRIEHENKVKEMNSILDSILNNIPVYLFVKDPGNEFRYLYWNRAFEEFSHIPASKALGYTDYEVFSSPKDAEHFRRDDLELLRTGERMEFIEEYVSAKGETRIVNTSKSLVPVENRLPLIIGVSWDITEQKNAELKVIEARIRAEESDRLKTAFLANMSHEIRTPLNAIVGFAKLMGEAETEEEKQQFIDIIDTNSSLLLQLIGDILDISKIEAGTLEFHFRPMNLNDLCRSEYEMHKGRTNPGVKLVFDERIENVEIVCDQNRLAQVISNLQVYDRGRNPLRIRPARRARGVFRGRYRHGNPCRKGPRHFRPFRQARRFRLRHGARTGYFENDRREAQRHDRRGVRIGKGYAVPFLDSRRAVRRTVRTGSGRYGRPEGRRFVDPAGRRGLGHQLQTDRGDAERAFPAGACALRSRGCGTVPFGASRRRAGRYAAAGHGRIRSYAPHPGERSRSAGRRHVGLPFRPRSRKRRRRRMYRVPAQTVHAGRTA